MRLLRDKGRQKINAGTGLLFFVVLALFTFLTGSSALVMGMGGGGGGSVCTSAGSEMPGVDALQPVTCGLTSPTAVAMDKGSRLYVTDSYSNSVVLYGQSGTFIDDFPGFAQPISIAVDSRGRIYVGNKGRGNVEVYDQNFKLLFKLGGGDGEFSRPNDIAVDKSGHVYVVDKNNNIVKIYSSGDGKQTGTLGSPGTGSGYFTLPVSIAIDEVAGEIIALDRPPKTSAEVPGARLQFFDMSGGFLRSSEGIVTTIFGPDEGQLSGPERITVDRQSRVYVTDSILNSVIVYDHAGCFVGHIFESVEHPLTPLGITIGDNNKLYLASHAGSSVEVYGIYADGLYGYSGMEIDPGVLVFESRQGEPNPTQMELVVKNRGNTSLTWSAEANESWIKLSGSSSTGGMTGVAQEDRLKVAVDKTGLEPGKYEGQISFTGVPGLTDSVKVTLTVLPAPVLVVNPETITFTSEVGTTPGPQTITVKNKGAAALSWSITAGSSWVSVNKASGIITDAESGSAEITVLADVTALEAGTYDGVIAVQGLNAYDNPAVIDVSLTLTQPAEEDPPATAERVIDDMDWSLTKAVKGVNLNGIWSSSESDVYIVGGKGMLYHYDGESWNRISSLTGETLNSVWGSSENDVYVVGNNGTILHYNGSEWGLVPTPTSKNLYGVWGSSDTNIYAVGRGGTILHYDGSSWSDIVSPTNKHLYAIWGNKESGDIYAVGREGTIIRYYNGAAWSAVASPTGKHLYGIWGDSDTGDVYAVGRAGTVLMYNGSEWNTMDTPTYNHLYSIWGTSKSDMFAVGLSGTVLHYNGSGWSSMSSGTNRSLYCVYGNDDADVYAVGQRGTVISYDGVEWESLLREKQHLYGIWGSSETDVFAVGNNGSIRHNDGTGWSIMDSDTNRKLYGVWGSSASDVFAVGIKGLILHYNGSQWREMNSPTGKHLYDVWGSSGSDVYAVGRRGTIIHYDGLTWSVVNSQTNKHLYGIWGSSASDIYAVGRRGTILRYQNNSWSVIDSPVSKNLYGVWGTSSNSIYAVGNGGVMLRYDGATWNNISLDITTGLYGVWASSDTDVFVAGQNGILMHYNGVSARTIDSGTTIWLRDVWGSTETTDVFAVGAKGTIFHGKNQ